MSRRGQGRSEVLRFWRSVELLSPPGVDAVNPEQRRYRVSPGAPLPWEPEHELAQVRLRPKQVWRHLVYLGVYRLDAVRDLVEERLGRDEESYDEYPGGESALAIAGVAHGGGLIPGSVVLSSCAWATGRIADGDVGRLEGFERAQAELATTLEDLAGGRVVDAALLARCVAEAAAVAGVAGVLPAQEVRVRSVYVPEAKAYEPDGGEFLNSFFAEDLARVADDYAAGHAGAALRAYLQTEAEASSQPRVDVRRDLGAVLSATEPAAVPLGRWPAAAAHPLALGQQLAVNRALAMAPDGHGLVGVNGPPGTGKTTMLRDVVAAVVVQRAQRLAELGHPRDAFLPEPAWWETDGYRRTVQRWRPALTGFELVVASSNNGAVERVTREIPTREAIDDGWAEAAQRVDYFPELASALLDEEAWGLAAAPLGAQHLRSRFVQRCWWGGRDDGDPEGLAAYLTRVAKEPAPPARDWSGAVATFQRAVEAEAEIQAARGEAFAALGQEQSLQDALAEARRVLSDAQARETAGRARLAHMAHELGVASAELARHRMAATEHRALKPDLLERLMSFGRATRPWRTRADALAERVASAERVEADARSGTDAAEAEVAEAVRAGASAAKEIDACSREVRAVQATLAAARELLGDQLPDGSWWDEGTRERRESAAPWTDPEWNEARSALFLAALALHREFLRHVPTEMRKSLHGAVDVLTGAAPRDLDEEAVRAAWHALFFVVPVVSTTFASFARMFGGLGRESLGWVLIDEGGQATPQSAAGALWRARRAVVVGDPLQLEPITTLSFRVEQALAREHAVDRSWSPSRLSAQRLADRATAFGTRLAGGDEPLWVGTPLAVHRRCDEPMFGFVNEVAYDGLMIHATGSAHAAAFDARHGPLPESKWIDVAGAEAAGHWIPAEGEQFDRILATLRDRGVAMADVLAIAPFRDGARHLGRRQERHPGLTAGTVHTAQGREADVVILVLGGDPRRPGAKRWAAARPNLVNVAASRARRRLYVIGDRAAWAQQRHFDVLARHLPGRAPVARDRRS